MKKLGIFVAMALSAILCLTSCLGEGKNQSSGSICGVYFMNADAGLLPMVDTGGGYIYVPELVSDITYSEGDCLGMGIMIDYNDPENANAGAKGYFTASLTAQPVIINDWRSRMIISEADTTTAMENEIPLNYGIAGSGFFNYVRGYLFFASGARIGSRQIVDWYLSYPQNYTEPVVKNGENHYQLFVRATAEGDNTGASNQEVNNAYYLGNVFDTINAKEAADNKQSLYLDINYVSGFDKETNRPQWASSTLTIPVMAVEQEQ